MNGITEIVGCSGAGKTQLCLQLSLLCQFPEVNKGDGKKKFAHINIAFLSGVLYICTEDAFPSKRLAELVEKIPQRYNHYKLGNINFKDNIYVEHLVDFVSCDNSNLFFVVLF